MPASRQARLTLPNCAARWMTCSRSPCTFSSRVIGRSSQSGSPATGWVTLGTIGQMALTVSGHKCQHYSGSGQPRRACGIVTLPPTRYDRETHTDDQEQSEEVGVHAGTERAVGAHADRISVGRVRVGAVATHNPG